MMVDIYFSATIESCLLLVIHARAVSWLSFIIPASASANVRKGWLFSVISDSFWLAVWGRISLKYKLRREVYISWIEICPSLCLLAKSFMISTRMEQNQNTSAPGTPLYSRQARFFLCNKKTGELKVADLTRLISPFRSMRERMIFRDFFLSPCMK